MKMLQIHQDLESTPRWQTNLAGSHLTSVFITLSWHVYYSGHYPQFRTLRCTEYERAVEIVLGKHLEKEHEQYWLAKFPFNVYTGWEGGNRRVESQKQTNRLSLPVSLNLLNPLQLPSGQLLLQHAYLEALVQVFLWDLYPSESRLKDKNSWKTSDQS